MSVNYFSFLHIIVLLSMLGLFGVLSFLAWRTQRKIFLPILFTNILVFSFVSVVLMFVIDKYTKSAKLEDVRINRILQNESLVVRARVRNTGKFTLSRCKLKVKLVNQGYNTSNFDGSGIFTPSGMDFFGWLSGKSKKANAKPNVVEHTQVVAKDLPAGRALDFSVAMPFPPYFTKVLPTTEISCY